jgi:hypothetical protein
MYRIRNFIHFLTSNFFLQIKESLSNGRIEQSMMLISIEHFH